MTIAEFISSLRTSGHVLFESPDPLPEGAALDGELMALDDHARRAAGAELPALDLVVARWAAGLLVRVSQFTVFREVDAATVEHEMNESCAAVYGPSAIHSADLVLRHLPALATMARGIAEDDPFVAGLRALAAAWPYSSVGMPDVGPIEPERLEPVLAHPGLRRCYVDRVVESADVERVEHPEVADAVREALGDHTQLCPRLAAVLTTDEQPR